MRHIYQVQLLNKIGIREDDHFFTSLSAIYDILSEETIGCKLPTLWKKGISGGNRYVNYKTGIVIKRVTLHSKKHKTI